MDTRQNQRGLPGRASSLATRLFVSATAWVVVILLITGIVLSSVYRAASERAFDRRLNLYLRTLVADVATPTTSPDKEMQSLGEPLFELPLSGWYWQDLHRLRKARHQVVALAVGEETAQARGPAASPSRRPASASAMSTAPKARPCAWWSGRSISAPTANIW